MKKCTVCKEEKSLDEFYPDATRKDGLAFTCKSCNLVIQRAYYERHKEKLKESAKERYHKNKDKINARRRQERIDNPEEVRDKANTYSRNNPIQGKVSGWKQAGMKDMTYERYLLMLEKQNYCCDICGKHEDECKTTLHVDHNHVTGIVRGLLCTTCNMGIGKLKDSIEMLLKAIDYLKRYE